MVSELGLQKIEIYKWTFCEHRHKVTIDNCWKSQLALQVMIFFGGADQHHFGLRRTTFEDRCLEK